MQHKDQHFIPQCYLKAWCDPETPPRQKPYVWTFGKDEQRGRRKAPQNIFHETDMYTIRGPDGGRDLSLEHGLAELEGIFAKLRDNVVAPRSPLSFDHRWILCTFAAAMKTRTPVVRDHWQKQWNETLAMAEDMQREIDAEGPTKNRYPSMPVDGRTTMNIEQAREIAQNPIHDVMAAGFKMVPGLFALDMAIMTTPQIPGFITSDAPCVWFDAEARKRPWPHNAPGLEWPTIEITLPLSPSRMLFLNRGGIRGLRGYMDTPDQLVDEFNRRTCGHGNEHIVVSRNVRKGIWFSSVPAPDLKPAEVGRNSRCPCGSGMKFKKCHGG